MSVFSEAMTLCAAGEQLLHPLRPASPWAEPTFFTPYIGHVRIGKKVKRQVPGGALEQRRDARHFAGEDRVPSHAELFV